MGNYDEGYERELIRGTQAPRPWDITTTIAAHLTHKGSLLDVGCGTTFKTLPLAKNVDVLYGLEPNEHMLAKAVANIRTQHVHNMLLVNGRCEKLPFRDNSLDFVTCIVAPHDTTEIHRVLCPGGTAVLEKIDDRDKANLKQEFGADGQGPRGQNSQFTPGGRAQLYESEFSAIFTRITIRSGFWNTWYTPDGLRLLLEQTPIIRDFDTDADAGILERIEHKYMQPKGIYTRQGHILIVAVK